MWQLYSLGMFTSSVLMYLLIRAIRSSTDSQLVNFFMFLPGIVFLLLVATYTKTNLNIDFVSFIILFLSTYIFSYLGNTASLRAIQTAPNTGYSLVIQKSYAIYTSIAAVFLFSSSLPISKFIIITAIAALLLTVADNKRKEQVKLKNNWVILSLLAFFMFGNLSLVSKYMLNLGHSALTITFYVFLFNILIQGALNRKLIMTGMKNITRKSWGLLLIIGILSASFNLFMRLALEIAPNIGYVNTINASSITVVTITSYFLFKDELKFKKLIAIIGVGIGVAYLLVS